MAPLLPPARYALCLCMVAPVFSFTAEAVQLDRPLRQETNFAFRLNCEPYAVYNIQQSTNLIDWRNVRRSDEENAVRAVTVPANAPEAFFRAVRTNEAVFRYAIAALEDIEATNAFLLTDSFDSSDPLYSTNARYDMTKRRDEGNIACVLDGAERLNLGNARVMGRVEVTRRNWESSDPLLQLGASGKVGSLSWHAISATDGKVEPLWSSDDLVLSFPPAKLPSGAGTPPVRLTQYGTRYVFHGVSYDLVLPLDGDYRLGNNETLTGNMYVAGNARLVVPASARIQLSGTDMIYISTNASLQLFVDCPSAILGGAGVINVNLATNFYFFGTTNNTFVRLVGNSSFTGCVQAPNATVELGSGGGVPIDYVGAFVARRVRFIGNASIHYDRNLLRSGPAR